MDVLWAICGVGAGSGLPLAGAMLATGLLGGVGHCAVMCGPLVLAQVGEEFVQGARSRLWTAALMPYHIGRIATYSGLGAAAGGAGAIAGWLLEARWVQAAALAAAAAVFAAQALGGLVRLPGAAAASPAPARRLRGVGLGLALGFLPCGLVYAALIAAAGAGGAGQGALAMTAFGLGTMPALVGVGWLGLAAGRRWLALARTAAPYLGLAGAVLLAALALRAI